MLTDAGAIGLSLIVIRLAARPAEGNLTFGLSGAEILSAQANGATLLVLAGLIVYEAIQRLIDPPDVERLASSLVVALAGSSSTCSRPGSWRRRTARSMNIEGSFQHILTDLSRSSGTAIAGRRHPHHRLRPRRPDRVARVAALMLRAAYGLLQRLGPRPARDGAPETTRTRSGRPWPRTPHVSDVHDLHVWEIGTACRLCPLTCSSRGRRLPRAAARARAAAPRAVPHRPHDAPGRPRPREPARRAAKAQR